jgi:hypothetical protein
MALRIQFSQKLPLSNVIIENRNKKRTCRQVRKMLLNKKELGGLAIIAKTSVRPIALRHQLSLILPLSVSLY